MDHFARMRRKKQVIDAKVGASQGLPSVAAGTARGLFLIHTGNGKSKHCGSGSGRTSGRRRRALRNG
jgi:hypothetical protein